MACVSALISFLFWKRKAPSLTNSRQFIQQGVPIEAVHCPVRWPLLLGKYLYSGLAVGRCVSMVACITNKKKIGVILSPCCTPISYGMSLLSFPREIPTMQRVCKCLFLGREVAHICLGFCTEPHVEWC